MVTQVVFGASRAKQKTFGPVSAVDYLTSNTEKGQPKVYRGLLLLSLVYSNSGVLFWCSVTNNLW